VGERTNRLTLVHEASLRPEQVGLFDDAGAALERRVAADAHDVETRAPLVGFDDLRFTLRSLVHVHHAVLSATEDRQLTGRVPYVEWRASERGSVLASA